MISYKPFLKLLIDREIRKKDLVEKTGIAWSTMAKINRNEYVSLEIIDRLCHTLNCQPGDLMEYIPDKKLGDNEDS